MRRLLRLLALLLALALTASACGGSGDDEAADGDSGAQSGIDDESVSDAMAMAGEDDGETTSAPTTMEEYEALWAANRADLVELLSSEEYGVDEANILHGPGGFEADLNDCPPSWSDVEGADGDTITLAEVVPQTGPIADQGRMAVGMESYFSYINENGGVGGKQLELLIRDGYDAAVTIDAVNGLLADDKPFAISTFGTPGGLGVYDTLNQLCVPQPFAWTGHPAFGDPVGHPWTTGMLMTYRTEAILWGNWIAQNLTADLPVSVGALVADNAFGHAYSDTFAEWATAHPEVISSFTPVPHDPNATSVTDQIDQIAAAQPDVYLTMTGGKHCLLGVEAVAASGLADTAKAMFTTSVCSDQSAYMIPAGDAGDGYLLAGGGLKSIADPRFADDAFVQFARERLEADGRDTSVASYGNGFAFKGWAVVEALRIAAELEGGITRSNYTLALHSLQLDHPFVVDGVTFSANGAEDAYHIEGTEFTRYDSSTQSWVPEGGTIDLDGLSGSCAWNGESC